MLSHPQLARPPSDTVGIYSIRVCVHCSASTTTRHRHCIAQQGLIFCVSLAGPSAQIFNQKLFWMFL